MTRPLRLAALLLVAIVALSSTGAAASPSFSDRPDELRASLAIRALGGSYKRVHFGREYPIRRVDLHGTAVTDADLAGLAALPALRDIEALDLRLTGVGDSAMVHVRRFKRVRFLNLFRTRVGDEGLATLRPLAALDTLLIGGTRVTDSGVRHVARFKRLSRLSLFDTTVGDAGLNELAPLGRLEVVLVSQSRVTESGKAALLRSHPRVRFTED